MANITEFDKEKSVYQIMQEVCEAICDKYCKWPEQWKPEEHDGLEQFDSGICDDCPLNRLQ